MLSICGAECCGECNRRDACGGCVKTEGHPFGGTCIAAECIERGGFEAFKKMKETLIEEFNALGIQALYHEKPILPRKINPLPDGLMWCRGMDTEPVLMTKELLDRELIQL